MSFTFDDIPFEVLLNFLMPHISIKEVGALAMVNAIWRDMCNDNEIWKVLYLRTVRAKVVDTSVHLGARCSRIREYHKPGSFTVRPYQPFCRETDWFYRWSTDLLHCGSGSKCIPNELRDKLLPWKDVRTDGLQTDEFEFVEFTHYHYRPKRNPTQYCEYIHKEWRKYNMSKGLSTINLCQCPEHYVFETLDVPGACRNYKSFKTITLKKLATSTKHEGKRALRQVNRERKEYLKTLRIMERAKAKYESANQEFQQNKSLTEKLSAALE